jgi:CubicO group peptidase (beta-lactamase class C family)
MREQKGVIAIPYPTLLKTHTPEEAGFSSEKLRTVDELIETDIKNGFPGAALVIVKDGKVVKNTAYGYAKKYDGLDLLNNPEKIKRHTMFDLASNTKMYATNYALPNFDDYVENNIHKPLGLKHTMFNPLQKGFKTKDFAATELMGNTRGGVINFPNIRLYTLQGEVHDEKAFYSMGGYRT